MCDVWDETLGPSRGIRRYCYDPYSFDWYGERPSAHGDTGGRQEHHGHAADLWNKIRKWLEQDRRPTHADEAQVRTTELVTSAGTLFVSEMTGYLISHIRQSRNSELPSTNLGASKHICEWEAKPFSSSGCRRGHGNEPSAPMW